MTKTRVTELANEHGIAYLDNYVAEEFSRESGQPVTAVLSVLRRQARADCGIGAWRESSR